jgi:hypothetical protein
MTAISERVWVSNSDRYYEQVLATEDGTRLRVQIRANFYQFQSYGLVERWNGEEWKRVVRIDGALLQTWEATRYPHEPGALAFEADVTILLDEAKAVLG